MNEEELTLKEARRLFREGVIQSYRVDSFGKVFYELPALISEEKNVKFEESKTTVDLVDLKEEEEDVTSTEEW